MNDNLYTSYPGGKSGSGVYQKLINMIPPHKTYIEPFLGGGAIMRLKKPAESNIGIDNDTAVIKRWSEKFEWLELYNDNAIAWLSNQKFSCDTFIYCDPPYLMSTRSTQRPLYKVEMASTEEHEMLLSVLLTLPCMVMISGYSSELYNDMLSGWRVHTYQAMTRSGRMATEYVWMNYPAPFALHDYRYLGNNYREREVIKRQKLRWLKRLESMPETKRLALLDAISTLASNNTFGDTTR